MHLTKNRLTQFTLVLVVFLIVVTAWELLVIITGMSEFTLPKPSNVAKQLVGLLQEVGFWKDATVTFSEVLLGFTFSIIVSIIVGALISQFLVLELSILPYIVGLQAIPSITMAPIFVNWLGYGMTSKILLVFTVASFPIIMMVVVGLQSSSAEQIQMLRSFGATRMQILKKVQIPNALPFFFTGLRLGVIMSVTGAVVAEFQGANAGLGYRILINYEQAKVADAFATIFVLATIGILLHALIGKIRSYVVFWVSSHGGVL